MITVYQDDFGVTITGLLTEFVIQTYPNDLVRIEQSNRIYCGWPKSATASEVQAALKKAGLTSRLAKDLKVKTSEVGSVLWEKINEKLKRR